MAAKDGGGKADWKPMETHRNPGTRARALEIVRGTSWPDHTLRGLCPLLGGYLETRGVRSGRWSLRVFSLV